MVNKRSKKVRKKVIERELIVKLHDEEKVEQIQNQASNLIN